MPCKTTLQKKNVFLKRAENNKGQCYVGMDF